MICDAFKLSLEGSRKRFNAEFAAARSANPNLDGGDVLAHLEVRVDPIIAAVARVDDAAVGAAVDVLYSLSLSLLGNDDFSRHPPLARLWESTLNVLAGHLARDPLRVAGSISNGVVNLCAQPGTRPDAWLDDLEALAAQAPDVDTLLTAGKVAAWRAGMAHYRQGALEAVASLPEDLAAAALGGIEAPLADVLAALAADPWVRPDDIGKRPTHLQVVARVGGFRGFGGSFGSPPAVGVSDGQFIGSDPDGAFQLCADVFGATFHRVVEPGETTGPPDAFERDGQNMAWRGIDGEFPWLPQATSIACDGHTLAVCTTRSHTITLVAPVP